MWSQSAAVENPIKLKPGEVRSGEGGEDGCQELYVIPSSSLFVFVIYADW